MAAGAAGSGLCKGLLGTLWVGQMRARRSTTHNNGAGRTRRKVELEGRRTRAPPARSMSTIRGGNMADKKPEFREDDSWFSEEQLAQLTPADEADDLHAPVPTQMVSNGEYMPFPQTAKQKEVEAPHQGAGRRRGEEARHEPPPVPRHQRRHGRVLPRDERSVRALLQRQADRAVRAGGGRAERSAQEPVRSRRPAAHRALVAPQHRPEPAGDRARAAEHDQRAGPARRARARQLPVESGARRACRTSTRTSSSSR